MEHDSHRTAHQDFATETPVSRCCFAERVLRSDVVLRLKHTGEIKAAAFKKVKVTEQKLCGAAHLNIQHWLQIQESLVCTLIPYEVASVSTECCHMSHKPEVDGRNGKSVGLTPASHKDRSGNNIL